MALALTSWRTAPNAFEFVAKPRKRGLHRLLLQNQPIVLRAQQPVHLAVVDDEHLTLTGEEFVRMHHTRGSQLAAYRARPLGSVATVGPR